MRTVLADCRAAIREETLGVIARHYPTAEVFEADSLTAALRIMIERHPVSLVVMDPGLPGMNGFQGLSALRRLFPETRCVLVSASDEPEAVAEAMSQGAHGFVRAWEVGARLPAALRSVLAGGRHLPPPTGPAPSPARLTPREMDILRLLGEGLPNKAIANRLAVSEVTVKSHLGRVFRKLGVQNRLQALRRAVEEFR